MRLICEAFALACLVAYGDVEGTSSAKLTKAYKADFVIHALEKLHPSFYPKPTRQMPGATEQLIHLESIEDGYLTKGALLKSYWNAANFLHFGTLEDVFSRRQKSLEFGSQIIWANKVVTLLDHHNILLADPPKEKRVAPLVKGKDGKLLPSKMIIFLMQSEDGQPHANLFELREAVPPSPE